MKVHECMTINPVTAQPLTRLSEAQRLMALHGLRHLPVVEPDGTFVGVIYEHDIRKAMSVDGDQANVRGILGIVKQGTPTLDRDSTVDDAWATLARSPGSNPLPVLFRGTLEGTVSHHDLLRALAGHFTPDRRVNGRTGVTSFYHDSFPGKSAAREAM